MHALLLIHARENCLFLGLMSCPIKYWNFYKSFMLHKYRNSTLFILDELNINIVHIAFLPESVATFKFQMLPSTYISFVIIKESHVIESGFRSGCECTIVHGGDSIFNHIFCILGPSIWFWLESSLCRGQSGSNVCRIFVAFRGRCTNLARP